MLTHIDKLNRVCYNVRTIRTIHTKGQNDTMKCEHKRATAIVTERFYKNPKPPSTDPQVVSIGVNGGWMWTTFITCPECNHSWSQSPGFPSVEFDETGHEVY